MSEIRVLVCDDQPLVRAGLRLVLEQEPDITVVGEAPDGAQAIRSTRALEPDVVLMDIDMPGVNGIEATSTLCGDRDTAARVLVLTNFALDEYVFDSLRAGASGFVLKDSPPDELADAIRVVASGEALLTPAVTRRVIDAFATPARARRSVRGVAELTPREHEVWELLARGLSNGEIAARLVLGESTVKTHVRHVLAKLGARDRVHAVLLAFEAGVVAPGDSDAGAAPPTG